MKVDDKIRELLEKAECVEHFYIKGEEFSILERRLYQKAISLLPKPCSKCESYTTGECVSKIPCDMDYSAFKPKPCQRPEQQLNKPPAGEIKKIKTALSDPNAPWYGSDLVPLVADLIEKYEALLKQIKELERACKEVRAYLIRWPEKTHQPYIYIIDQALKGE